jgi:hypothetical protein
MMTFGDLLSRFVQAVETNDGDGLASLFTEDGVYDDGFFGEYQGREAIKTMLGHFYDGGRDYRWEFLDPLSNAEIGYARYRFSYASTLPESLGKPVVFEGMSCFNFRDGKIARYSEVFDRGMALAQLDFAAERIKRVMLKLAARQNAAPGCEAHLRRLERKTGTADPA